MAPNKDTYDFSKGCKFAAYEPTAAEIAAAAAQIRAGWSETDEVRRRVTQPTDAVEPQEIGLATMLGAAKGGTR